MPPVHYHRRGGDFLNLSACVALRAPGASLWAASRGRPAGPRGCESLPRAARPANRLDVRQKIVTGGGLGACVLACAGCLQGEALLPLDQPRFPTGLAVTPDGESLLVVSSNFDLAFDDGALLVADLDRVRKALDDADDADQAVAREAYTSGAYLPPFGDAPVITSDGSRALVPTRGANLIASLDVSAKGALGCGDDAGDPPRCGVAPRALQLPANDPLATVILSESFDGDGDLQRVGGMTALLSSPDVYFFADDPTRPAAERMQITGTVTVGEGIRGVRSVAVRPALYGSDRTVFAAAEIDAQITGVFGAVLAMFLPAPNAAVTLVDVSRDTGALGVRDMLLVPGADGADDGLAPRPSSTLTSW